MKRVAFFNENPHVLDGVYGRGRRERLAELAHVYPAVITSRNFAEHADALQDVEAAFSTWGMWDITPHLDRLPELSVLFYAAGSVKAFGAPLMDRGITVVSAWAANAIPVAEFALAQILLACKGYFRNAQGYKAGRSRKDVFCGKGVYGERVAIIGAGMIGRTLIQLLKNHALEVVVVDPYLTQEEAAELGIVRVSLEQAFATAYVISNHVPNTAETKGMFHAGLFKAMRDDATFINTGRGASVDEAALIAELERRPSLTALLDVTHPEPPSPDSKLFDLPNVHLSTHIAGALNDERTRLADFCIEEFQRWQNNQPLRYAVPREKLEIMA